MNSTFFAIATLCVTVGSSLLASPLDTAKLGHLVNDVQIAGSHGRPRRAAEQEVIRADEGLRVGPRSRAEMVFPDGTLARLGAETALGFRPGTRELALERGTLLIQVPGFRGGARVRVGALTAVCGAATILIEHLPSRSLKIVVLEGDLRVATAGFFGDSIVIPPGKMLITTPEVKSFPDPVDVDLSILARTSALINAAAFSPGAAPLASLPRIEREIARQAGALKVKRLIPTNLAILGSGTNVVIPTEPASRVAAGPAPEENAAEPVSRNEKAAPAPANVALDQRPVGLPVGLPEVGDTLSNP